MGSKHSWTNPSSTLQVESVFNKEQLVTMRACVSTLVFSIQCLLVTAQTNAGRPFFDSMHQYYLSDPVNEAIPRNGAQKQYDRAFMEWAPRLWPHGDFTVAANAWVGYAMEFHGGDEDCAPFEVEWEELGPIGMPMTNSLQTSAKGVGQIHRLTYDPRYGVENVRIYATSSYGGLWVSENDGDLWTPLNTDAQLPLNAVADVAISYQDENDIFLCTGNADGQFGNLYWQSSGNLSSVNSIFTIGIYRSRDRGQTWHPINDGFLSNFVNGGSCRRMIVDPIDANKLYVATSLGVFRTLNALDEFPVWVQINEGIDVSQLDTRGLEFKPGLGNSTTLYRSGLDVYKSTDGGNTWESLTGSGTGLDLEQMPGSNFTTEIINIATTIADDRFIYALIYGKTPAGKIFVYRYDGVLGLWEEVFSHTMSASASTHLSPSWMPIAVSPVNANTVFIGGSVVRGDRDIESGSTFLMESSYNANNCHADIHALAFQPNVPEPKLLAGHDGGISEKVVSGNSSTETGWQWKNNGLAVKTIWNLGVSDVHPKSVVIGNQDTGSDIILDGQNWGNISGGDGYGAQVLYKGDRVYLTMANTSVYYRTNEQPLTASFETQYFPPDPAENTSVYKNKSFKVVEHPDLENPWVCFNELYERVVQSPTGGSPPQDVYELRSDLGFLSSQHPAWSRQLTELAIAESDPNFIYTASAGVNNGENFEPNLFRSTNGWVNGIQNVDPANPVFEDIRANLPDMTYFQPTNGTPIVKPVITGIAVDPTDPQHLWLSFSGFDPGVKVYESYDAGDTWVNADPLGSLANLPANDIVYQPGTNDRLYLATDVGVYYNEDGMDCWVRYGDIPNVRVTELEVNRCSGKLVAATYGRGVWQVDMLPMNTALEHFKVVDSDVVWEGDTYVHGNVRVVNEARLTVIGTVHFPKGGSLIIEPGAQLIVNGGTLTNSCGEYWGGVQVWGNSAMNQSGGFVGGQYRPTLHQGYLELRNGGVIENALVGAMLNNPLADDASGGVIRMVNGTVRNCQQGVVIADYMNFGSTTNVPASNRSSFINSTFTVTDALPGGDDFREHVRMSGISGIVFSGCSFKNEQTTITESAKLGYGIHSFDANYKVKGLCQGPPPIPADCPGTIVQRTTFNGLDHGIHALEGTSSRSFQVDNTTFTDNICGVYSEGVVGFKVVNSKFEVGGNEASLTNPLEENWQGFSRGVFSTTGYGFIVDDNQFARSGSAPAEGLVVGYSGDHSDMVFRNTASGLDAAYIGEGVCADPSNRSYIGLNFQCNTNHENRTNLWSRRVDDPFGVADQTIRTHQGKLYRAPDNSFDRLAGNWDVQNTNFPDNVLTYWWRAPDAPYRPIQIDPPNGAIVTNNSNGTPVNRPEGNCASRRVIFTYPYPPRREPLMNGLMEHRDVYVANKYLHKTLLDGGSTDELVEEVMASWPEEVWLLRNSLLQKSPFLTVEVLEEMMLKPTLPMAIKAEICIANPDATKSEGFLEFLEIKAEPPMPANLVASVEASWQTKTFRTELESNLAHDHGEMTQNANLLLEYFGTDSVEHVDSLRGVWQLIRTPAARYAEALTYLQQEDFGAAKTVIEDLPEEHVLKVKQESERWRMLALIEYLQEVKTNGRSVAHLNIGEQEALEAIIADQRDRPATWAQNILCFHYGKCRAPLTGDAKTAPKSRQVVKKSEVAVTQVNMQVYPNPANKFANVMIGLGSDPVQAVLVVQDMAGREMHRQAVQQKDQQVLLDTRAWPNGAYTIRLVDGSSVLKVERLVIER
jgi:hypothetical protein